MSSIPSSQPLPVTAASAPQNETLRDDDPIATSNMGVSSDNSQAQEWDGWPDGPIERIFLNDEQPDLQNWAMDKFTNGTGASLTNSPFNHLFYGKL